MCLTHRAMQCFHNSVQLEQVIPLVTCLAFPVVGSALWFDHASWNRGTRWNIFSKGGILFSTIFDDLLLCSHGFFSIRFLP